MYSSVFLGVFYQSKNYIGLNRILTFTLGQLMGKCFLNSYAIIVFPNIIIKFR